MIKVTTHDLGIIRIAQRKIHNKDMFDYIYENATKLSMVEVAQICEGHSFEAIREFQVGDIIQNKSGELLRIVEGGSEANKPFTRGVKYVRNLVKNHNNEFTLICKVENTERYNA